MDNFTSLGKDRLIVEEEVNDPKMSPYANLFFLFFFIFSTCVSVDEFSRGAVNFWRKRESRRVDGAECFPVTSLGDITVRSAVHYCYYGVKDRTDVSLCLYLSKKFPKTRQETKKKEKENAEIPHTKASGRDRTGRYGTSHASLTSNNNIAPAINNKPGQTRKPKWMRWESFYPIQSLKKATTTMRGILLRTIFCLF